MTASRTFARILVPIDFQPATDEQIAAGQAVLVEKQYIDYAPASLRSIALAAELASLSGGTLILLHVTPPLAYSSMYTGSLTVGLSQQVMAEVHKMAHDTSIAALQAVAERHCAGINVQFEARPGVALSVILGEALAAARARGLFQLIRDRLQDRNSPGIAVVDAQLAGDPKLLDPAVVQREIDVALVKRARKYCSHAIDARLTGVEALTSVTEGLAYTRILLPGMRAAIRDPAFVPATHVATWQHFAEAAEQADDPEELKKLSAELVQWNCAYQQALGIRECTATVDEQAAAAGPTKPARP